MSEETTTLKDPLVLTPLSIILQIGCGFNYSDRIEVDYIENTKWKSWVDDIRKLDPQEETTHIEIIPANQHVDYFGDPVVVIRSWPIAHIWRIQAWRESVAHYKGNKREQERGYRESLKFKDAVDKLSKKLTSKGFPEEACVVIAAKFLREGSTLETIKAITGIEELSEADIVWKVGDEELKQIEEEINKSK